MQCHVSHFFEILLIPKRICWLFNHSDMPKFEAREARLAADLGLAADLRRGGPRGVILSLCFLSLQPISYAYHPTANLFLPSQATTVIVPSQPQRV